MAHEFGHPEFAAPEPESRKWGGKYNSPEELERGHDSLQSTLTDRNRRIQELEMALQSREQETERMMPADRAAARPDPYEVLREMAVPPEAIEEIVDRRLKGVMDPFIQGAQARQMIEQEYPDFVKMENEVAQFIASSPDLKVRYQKLYKSDQLGAMEWALNKFHRAGAAKPPQIRNDDSRADAMLPGSGGGESRGDDLENENQDRLAKAYEYGTKYGDWQPYTAIRLGEVIPESHYTAQYGR